VSVATVGSLIVEIGANVAGLQRDLGKMNHMVNKATRSIESAFKTVGISIAGYLSARALLDFGRQSLDTADHISKLSQSVGISVEELSGFSFAARLADVDLDTIGKSVAKFNKYVAESADTTNKIDNAFAAMGISIRDSSGAIKDSGTLLGEVADKFAGYRDSATKTALAMEIFGKAGANMIPLLNAGSAGIQSMKDEAAKLGLVLSGDMARAAEEVNDNFTRIKAVFEGATNQIMAGLLPTLKDITETFIRVLGPTTDWTNVVAALSVVLQSAAGLLLLVKLGIDKIGEGISWVVKKYDDWTDAIARNTAAYRDSNMGVDLLTGEKIKTAVESGEKIKKAISSADGYVAQGKDKIRGTTKDYVAVWTGASASLGEAIDKWRDTSRTLQDAPIIANGAAGGGKEVRDKVMEIVTALQLEEAQLGRTATMQRVYNELQKAGITITDAGAQTIQAYVTRIEERKAAEERLTKIMDAGKRVTEDMMTPLEEYADRVDDLNKMLEAGAISHETWDRAVKAAADSYDKAAQKLDEFTEFAKEAARNIQDALGTTLESVLDGKWNEIGGNFRTMLNKMVAELLSSQLLKLLLGDFGKSNAVGGWAGSLLGLFGFGGSSIAGVGGEGGALSGAMKFASGGWINEPVAGIGRSGRRYLMGEAGPEQITPAGKAGGNTFVIQTRDPDTRVFQSSRGQQGAAAVKVVRRGMRYAT